MTERRYMSKLVSKGYLKIGNEEDRKAVASILYKNGYSVAPVRCKRNGKRFSFILDCKVQGGN